MRVLIVTRNFPPRSCGVGDYASGLAQAMAAAGDFVTVLTEPADVPRHVPIGLREQPLRGWADLQPVLREIQSAGPDRVQLEYSGYAWGRRGVAWWVNALLFWLRRIGVPVHIGLHETAIRMRQHPLQVPLALMQWVHIGMMLAVAETVALNMRSRVELLGRLFPWWRKKLRYRPNSSNIPVVPITLAERSALRRDRGVEDKEAVVATFGMFHTAKHYEALVGAVTLMRDPVAVPGRGVKLWMLGDVTAASPEYIARLKAMAVEGGIEERIWWSGRLEPLDVSRLLQAADVFVLPQPDGHLTRSGSFMAAAAHGLPVVAVRDATGRDQSEFSHQENVWLVARSVPEEIAAGISELVHDAAASRQMGNSLQRLYEARFSWRAAVALLDVPQAPRQCRPAAQPETDGERSAEASRARAAVK